MKNRPGELDIKFTIPDSRPLSVRITREEERVLTAAARFHGMKLSTYVKQQALAAAHQPQTSITVTETLR